MSFLAKLLVTPLIWLLGIAGYAVSLPQQNVGSTVPQAYAVFETYLANQQAVGDTTLTLASGTLRDGTTLSGYVCLTIDTNLSTLEYECGTASGTSVTGLTRGIDPLSGTTTVATLKYAHRRGADAKITDYPLISILGRQASGVDTYPNPLLYFAHPCSVSSASTTVCDKNYIDGQVVAGSAAGNNTTAGIFLLATAKQAASSTATGVFNSITYNNILAASYATDTPGLICQTAATGGCSVMSLLNGKLNQSWLDLTQNFTFTGTTTSNGNTSILATAAHPLQLNGNYFSLSSTQGASSTVLSTNGSGALTWEPQPYFTIDSLGAEVSNGASTASTTLRTVVIPANTLSTAVSLEVNANFEVLLTGSGACWEEIDIGNGQSTTSATYTANSLGSLFGYLYATSTNRQALVLNNTLAVQSSYSNASPIYLYIIARTQASNTCVLFGDTVGRIQ